MKYRDGSWKVDDVYPNYKNILNVIDYIFTHGNEIDGIPRLSSIKLAIEGMKEGVQAGTVAKALTEE